MSRIRQAKWGMSSLPVGKISVTIPCFCHTSLAFATLPLLLPHLLCSCRTSLALLDIPCFREPTNIIVIRCGIYTSLTQSSCRTAKSHTTAGRTVRSPAASPRSVIMNLGSNDQELTQRFPHSHPIFRSASSFRYLGCK